MPLTTAQKDFIEAAIEHLLDFSSEITELKQQAFHLREALHSDVPETHEFHQLRKCIVNPARNLQGLERCGATETTQAATLLDVQSHIIALCRQKISSSAHATNMSLSALGLDNLEALLPSGQPSSIFKSESAPTQAHYMPWEYIHETGQIGFSTLIVSENLRHIDLNIRLWLPNETHYFTINHITDLPPNTDMTQFLMGLISETLDATLDFTKEYILKRFKFDWIEEPLLQQAYTDDPFSHIINNEYFLQLLLSNSVDIQLLLNLSHSDMHKLLNPITISLLKINFCNIAQAKQLTNEQIMVASCYTSLIQNRKLLFSELSDLSTMQCKLMAHPVIANLIKQNKLRSEDAQKLPSVFLKILSVNFYLDHFSRQDINWSLYTSVNAQQGERLLHPKVLKLITTRILTVDDFIHMSDKHFELVTQDKIFRLICGNKITRQHVISTPSHYFHTITLCDELYHYLEASIISMSEFQTSRLINIIEDGFFKRLLAIYEQRPYCLRGQKDDALQWLNDLEKFTSRANLQLRFIKEKIISQFMTSIKPDIQRMAPGMMLSREKKSYKLLIHCENSACMFASADSALYQLVQLARDVQNDLDHKQHTHRRFGLFKHSNKQRDAYRLCEHILSVAALVMPNESHRPTLSRGD